MGEPFGFFPPDISWGRLWSISLFPVRAFCTLATLGRENIRFSWDPT